MWHLKKATIAYLIGQLHFASLRLIYFLEIDYLMWIAFPVHCLLNTHETSGKKAQWGQKNFKESSWIVRKGRLVRAY